jgi:hypothetical protein
LKYVGICYIINSLIIIDNKTACDKRDTNEDEGNKSCFHVDITQIRLDTYISHDSVT